MVAINRNWWSQSFGNSGRDHSECAQYLKQHVRELSEVGVIFEQKSEHRTGAFDAGLVIVATFVVGSFAGAIIKEAGKDVWDLIKVATKGVFGVSSVKGADCVALLTARDEKGARLEIRSPIESELDVNEFAEIAKRCIDLFLIKNYEQARISHRKIRVSVSVESAE